MSSARVPSKVNAFGTNAAPAARSTVVSRGGGLDVEIALEQDLLAVVRDQVVRAGRHVELEAPRRRGRRRQASHEDRARLEHLAGDLVERLVAVEDAGHALLVAFLEGEASERRPRARVRSADRHDLVLALDRDLVHADRDLLDVHPLATVIAVRHEDGRVPGGGDEHLVPLLIGRVARTLGRVARTGVVTASGREEREEKEPALHAAHHYLQRSTTSTNSP